MGKKLRVVYTHCDNMVGIEALFTYNLSVVRLFSTHQHFLSHNWAIWYIRLQAFFPEFCLCICTGGTFRLCTEVTPQFNDV